ncbi:MAG: HAD family hydrolase [Anaerolineales bacterium]
MTKHNTNILPSWNEGAAKDAILQFVKSAVDLEGSDFIHPNDRIAVFDNDGTLWSERPIYFQLAFGIEQVQKQAEDHPEWGDDLILNAAIHGDHEKILEGGVRSILHLALATVRGETTEEFARAAREWIGRARHPETDRLYTEMVFQPMLELLDYLRTNGFRTFIISGGGLEFMRVWAEEVYGIPTEQVLGSSFKAKYEMREDGPVLVRLPDMDFFDDGEGKPVGIHKFIGRRPLIAFGNSDGDLPMMQWTAAGKGPRFMGYVHHTDAEREWAYDRDSLVGRFDKGLDEARARGWTLVDMKNDWKVVYPFELT